MNKLMLCAIALAIPACAQHADSQESDINLEPGKGYICTYEDMLPYQLMTDAFDHKKGEIICIHIDQANDAPTPENPEGFER
jgi:hypothetical protein